MFQGCGTRSPSQGVVPLQHLGEVAAAAGADAVAVQVKALQAGAAHQQLRRLGLTRWSVPVSGGTLGFLITRLWIIGPAHSPCWPQQAAGKLRGGHVDSNSQGGGGQRAAIPKFLKNAGPYRPQQPGGGRWW